MQLKRLFKTAQIKNTYGYINSQKKYEVLRTLLYVAISVSLYIAGYIATKSNKNFLTIAAILGVLPSTKSLIGMIMFLRYHSCSLDIYEKISSSINSTIPQLYDLVFTSEKVNYPFSHCVYADKNLYFFTEAAVDAEAFKNHLNIYLERAEIKGVTAQIFTDIDQYLKAIPDVPEADALSGKVIQLLKEISL